MSAWALVLFFPLQFWAMRIVHSQQEHSRQFFVAGILIPLFFYLLLWHRIPLLREFVQVLLFLWFVSVQMPVVTPCLLCFRFPSQQSATSHSLSPSIHPLECHYTKLSFSVELLSVNFMSFDHFLPPCPPLLLLSLWSVFPSLHIRL